MKSVTICPLHHVTARLQRSIVARDHLPATQETAGAKTPMSGFAVEHVLRDGGPVG
jgi:hypothetical protein